MALIVALRPEYENCIADHEIRIEWFPHGYTDDPKELPEYAISLFGNRFVASWLILEIDLYRVLRSHMSQNA